MSASMIRKKKRLGSGVPLILLAAFLALPAAAEQPAERQVRGVVTDTVTGEPIPGARVTAGSRAVVAGPGGDFVLTVEAGTVALLVTAPGYFEGAERILPGDARLEARLLPRRIAEEVRVTAAPPELERPSATEVEPVEVLETAGTVDNIFRALSTLPGVAAATDFGSRLAVRGGTPDQNLTLMDGIEIHNPYRLFGLVSAFNPETVESFSLAAGGFGARYGDRLSSLLTVENRPGDDRFAGTTSLSITDGNLVFEGPLPGPGTFLLTGRRTYYDVIVGRLIDQNLPSFLDTQLHAAWDFGGGHRLTLIGLRSREDTDFSLEDDEEEQRFALAGNTASDLGAVRLEAVLSPRATSRTVLAAYENTEQFAAEAVFRDGDRSSALGDDEPGAFTEIAFDRELAVRDLSLRQELAAEWRDSQVVEVGFELHRLRSGIYQTIDGARNESVANPTSIQGGSGLPDFLDSELNGMRGGAWIQDAWQARPNLALEPGLRLEWTTVNDRAALLPRLSARWEVRDGLRISAAGGIYTQSPGYEKLIQSDYLLDLSHLKEDRIRHERAAHAVLGIEQILGDRARWRVEGYWKRFSDLLVGRLETPAERDLRLAAYDFPDALAASVPAERQITVNAANGGAGTAWGLDVYLERLDPSARLGGWISYAFGRAERETYGRRYPFEYDRPHAGNLVGQWRATDRFTLAGTLRLASGFPYTPSVGVRVAATRDERGRLVPETDDEGNLIYAADLGGLDNLQSGRLPAYARLDLRLTWRPGGPASRWSVYAEVINALGRENALQIQPSVVSDPVTGAPTVDESADAGFPRIPTLGIRFRF